MNIETMTSKEISDKLAENGIKMHFNSKRTKLVEALNNINNSNEDTKMEATVNEEGWHIPNIIYQNMITTECQIFKKVTRNGQDTMEAVKIKSYNVEVLPALTQDEIDKIAIRQKATSSVG